MLLSQINLLIGLCHGAELRSVENFQLFIFSSPRQVQEWASKAIKL